MDTLIKGHRHHPLCSTCRTPMDWLRIYQKGKGPQEFAVCPKCHEPELELLTSDGRETRLRIEKDGAFGLV